MLIAFMFGIVVGSTGLFLLTLGFVYWAIKPEKGKNKKSPML